MSKRNGKNVEDIISNINDESLRIALQILYILINDPGVYNLNELKSKIGAEIVPTIKAFLDQNLFAFYLGNTKITCDNADDILKEDSKEKLSVITRVNFNDSQGFDRFYALLDKYEKSESKRKILEKIVVFNSYRVKDSLKESSVKQDIIQCLAKEKTMEYVFSIDGSKFYPIAIYRSRQYDREYYVTLQKIENRYRIKFYPYDDEFVKKGRHSQNEVLISDVYPDISSVKIAKEKIKSIWGPQDMYIDEEPFEVSAIIYDKSCLGKIKHDISKYKYEMVENDNGTYQLRLKALGYEAFKTWALRYGSSIEIREPKNLRDDIIKTYNEIREKYLQ